MAYLPPEDDKTNQQGMNTLGSQAPEQNQQPMQTSGAAPSAPAPMSSSPAPSGQAPQQSQARPPRQPRGSGSFVNLRRYIDENKPATQRLSQAVGSNVGKQEQAIRQGLESSQKRFQQGLQQGQQRLDQARQFTSDAVQKAGSGQLTDPEFQRYQNIVTGSERYADVSPIDLSQQQARVSALKSLLQRPESEQTRQNLVQQTFSGPGRSSTRGQQNLDAFLLGADPQAAQSLAEQTKGAFAGLNQDINQARRQSLENLQGLKEAQAGFTGVGGEAEKAIMGQEGALTKLQSDLTNRVGQRQTELLGRRDALRDKLKKGEFLSISELDELGVPKEQQGLIQSIGTIRDGSEAKYDLSRFLNFDPASVTQQNVATSPELARANALARLAGRTGMGEAGQQAGLQFRTDEAIRDYLQRTNQSDLNFGDDGLTGTQDALQTFQQGLLAANPFLGASMIGLQQLGLDPLAAASQVGDLVGSDVTGAAAAIGEGVDQGTDALTSNLKFVVNPFELDSAKNLIDASGNVVQSVADIGQRLSPKISGNRAVDAFLTGGLSEVGNVTKKILSPVRKIFCFAKDAMIDMMDGSTKAIQDLVLGDEVLEGGKILGIGQVLVDELYEYKGNRVTENHGVLENGQWIRVKDSKLSKKLDIDYDIVYPVIAENHLLVSNGYISTDSVEVDAINMSDEEKLEYLNSLDNTGLINKYEKQTA